MNSQHHASASPARRPALACSLAAAVLLAASGAAQAGATINGPGDSWFSIGAGMRLSYTSAEDAAPDGSRSNDFEIDSVRIFTSGQLMKGLKATINFEKAPDEDVRILDAMAQFEFYDTFNVWAGRFLPPSDRANLAGPYFASSWLYPFVSQYPARFAGRDNGVAVWGKPMGGKLVYAFGAFEGHNNEAGASNDGDNLLYAGRISYSFFDPEPAPGYYVSNTYYGSNDILTVGAVYMYQSDGVGVPGNADAYKGYNLDVLFEKKLGADSALTLEGAYYRYDFDVPDCGTFGAGPCPGGDNIGGLTAGKAWLASAAYLIPGKFGIGQLQPYVRYQHFKRDEDDTKMRQFDIGVNYVMKGHDARISATYSVFKDEGGADENIDAFIIGVQLMY